MIGKIPPFFTPGGAFGVTGSPSAGWTMPGDVSISGTLGVTGASTFTGEVRVGASAQGFTAAGECNLSSRQDFTVTGLSPTCLQIAIEPLVIGAFGEFATGYSIRDLG